MRYGLIISAGKQTRFKSECPKALAKIGDERVLDINIRHMKQFCDKVFVVCSYENKDWFHDYERIEIESGYGCGDAVMKGLEKLNASSYDYVFVQWGDCVHKSTIYQSLINAIAFGEDEVVDGVVIPCVTEEKPYVQITPNPYSRRFSVFFSKYGEKTSRGYHDLSLFYSRVSYLLRYLHTFKDNIWDKEKKCYVHKHGNEMQFLDVFNETLICGLLLDMGDYKDFSFNTEEELNQKIEEFTELTGKENSALKKYYSGKALSFSDLIAEKFTPEQIAVIDEFQIYKYMWRWKEKNGPADLEKAKYYLEDLIKVKKLEDK